MNDTTFEQGQSFLKSPDANDKDLRNLRYTKQENRELGLRQQEMISLHTELTEKAARMNDNLKKMNYAECMESKINITSNQLNR